MKFSVGCPGYEKKTIELIEECDKLNQNIGFYHNNYIEEIYLSLKSSESNNLFISGRDLDADLDFKGLERVIKKARQLNINPRLLLNSPNIDSLFKEEDNRKSAHSYLKKIQDAGIRKVTIASEYLLKLIKNDYPKLHVAISSYLKVNEPKCAKEFENLGASRLILPNDLNKNWLMLKEIRKSVNCEIELMPNLGCIEGCPYHGIHGAYLDMQSKSSPKERRKTDPFKKYCFAKMEQKPNKIIFIRPENTEKYENLGINYFKIVGRQLPVNWIKKAAKAYMERKFDGNLAEILSPTYAIANKVFL